MYIDINSCATIVSKSFFLFLNLFIPIRIVFHSHGEAKYYIIFLKN